MREIDVNICTDTVIELLDNIYDSPNWLGSYVICYGSL